MAQTVVFPPLKSPETPFIFEPETVVLLGACRKGISSAFLQRLKDRPSWPRTRCALELLWERKWLSRRQLVRLALADLRERYARECLKEWEDAGLIYRFGWGKDDKWSVHAVNNPCLGLDLGGARALGMPNVTWEQLHPPWIDVLRVLLANEIGSQLRGVSWTVLPEVKTEEGSIRPAAGFQIKGGRAQRFAVEVLRGSDSLEVFAERLRVWSKLDLRRRVAGKDRIMLLCIAELEAGAQAIEEMIDGLKDLPRVWSTDYRVMTRRPWEQGAFFVISGGGVKDIRAEILAGEGRM